MEDEITRDMWAAFKNLFRVVVAQQEQIEKLGRSHYKLVSLLAGETDTTAQADREKLDRMQAGIRELEKMFGTGEEGVQA